MNGTSVTLQPNAMKIRRIPFPDNMQNERFRLSALRIDVLYTEKPKGDSDTQRLDAQIGSDMSWTVAHGCHVTNAQMMTRREL